VSSQVRTILFLICVRSRSSTKSSAINHTDCCAEAIETANIWKMNWMLTLKTILLLQGVLWIYWIYCTQFKDLQQILDSEPSALLSTEFYRFNQSIPLTEYLQNAQMISQNAQHVDLDSILSRCLQVQTHGHVQAPNDWFSLVTDLKSLTEIVLNSNSSFSWFVVKVSKDDEDMTRGFSSPNLYGSTLCANLAESYNAKYCRTNWNDDVPEWPKKKDLRIPTLVCTRSAAVNRFGFVRKGAFQVVPTPRYRQFRDDSVRGLFQIVADPVFSIAQFPGNEVYHFIVECLSRLAPFYEQLLENHQIKIHITSKKFLPFMTFLGFPEDRILDEHVLTNSTLMFSDPHPTGSKRSYVVRKLARILTKRLESFFPDLERNRYVVIIRRSKTRSITNFDEMLQALEQRFPGETFVIYRDDPCPSVPDTFRMFYEAKMIIAPHGAGLSNTLVSNPGTPIIEFLTDDKKKLNFCFVDLSRSLGFQHEAFSPPGSKHNGTFTVDIDFVMRLASKYL